jgi:hypothetical protein
VGVVANLKVWECKVAKRRKNKSDRRRTRSSAERRLIARLYRQLLRQNIIRFPPVGENLDVPDEHGVYIIRDRSNHIVHVGRTYRGTRGLWQRLNNHLQGQSSFVEVFLSKKKSRLRKGYTYQFLDAPRARYRALLEHLATGLLCPEHLGVGKSRLQ